jgi:hypothetical protein
MYSNSEYRNYRRVSKKLGHSGQLGTLSKTPNEYMSKLNFYLPSTQNRPGQSEHLKKKLLDIPNLRKIMKVEIPYDPLERFSVIKYEPPKLNEEVKT